MGVGQWSAFTGFYLTVFNLTKFAFITCIALACLTACARTGFGQASGQATPSAHAPNTDAPLRLIQTIPLPSVKGRIDHLALDADHQQLAVAALGNDTVEVVDLRAGERSQQITGLHEPQGVVLAAGRFYVTNGQTGVCTAFDSQSWHALQNQDIGDDADNIRYDPATHHLFIGYGNGALALVDAPTLKRVGDIKLDGHPESFQLEQSGSRLYVNVPDAGHVAVVDRQRKKVIATWPTGTARANFPMALDEAHQRLFVGCRRPACLLVFDTRTGAMASIVPIAGDADDVFYDAVKERLYIACGAGSISVVQVQVGKSYRHLVDIPTAEGARTAWFEPTSRRLYLAVPKRGLQGAEVRVYAAAP